MATTNKRCYRQLNGKWYTESDYLQIAKLSAAMKNGDIEPGTREKLLNLLAKGVLEQDIPGEQVEDTMHPGRLTKKALQDSLLEMGSIFEMTSLESEHMSDMIETAHDKGYVSKGFIAEDLILDSVFNGAGLNRYQVVALQRAFAHYETEIRKLNAEYIGADKETRKTLSDRILAFTDRAELYSMALGAAYSDAGKTLAMIRHMNKSFFSKDPNEIIDEEFAALDPERRSELKKLATKIIAMEKEIAEARSNSAAEAAKITENQAKEVVNQMVKGKTNTGDPKKKKTPAETSKAFLDFFFGKSSPKVKLQGPDGPSGDTAENDTEVEKLNHIKDYAEMLVKTKGISDLTALVQEIMSTYNNHGDEFTTADGEPTKPINVSDIYTALILHGQNKKKQTEYAANIAMIRSTAKRMRDIQKIIDAALTGAKEISLDRNKRSAKNDAHTNRLKELDKTIRNLQKVFLNGHEGFDETESEKIFTNFEYVRTSLELLYDGLPPEQVESQAANIAARLQDINNAMSEKKLQDKLDQLKADGKLTDTKVPSLKPLLSSKIYMLKERLDDLKSEYRHRAVQAEFLQKLEDKYGDKKITLGGKKGIRLSILAYNAKQLAKSWYQFPARYLLGGDIGIIFLHGGFGLFKSLGQYAVLGWTKSGRAEANQSLLDTLNFIGTTAKSFKQGFSIENKKETFIKQYEMLLESPNGALAKHLGLSIIRPFSGDLITSQDDFFAKKGLSDLQADSKLMKVFTTGARIFDQASEGGYVMGLNEYRMSMFNLFIASNSLATLEEKKQAVKYINEQTGTITAGEFNTGFISYLLISPKLYYSRIKMLLKIGSSLNDLRTPEKRLVAKMRIRDSASFLLGQAVVIMAAGAAGWEWEKDPRSNDFLKFRKGTKSFDLTAGFGKWINMALAPIVAWDHFAHDGAVLNSIFGSAEIDEEFNPQYDTPSAILWQKTKYMLHGTISGAFKLTDGQDVIGQPLGTNFFEFFGNWFSSTYTPLSLNEVLQTDMTVSPQGTAIKDKNWFNKFVDNYLLDGGMKFTGSNLVDYDNNFKHLLVQDYLKQLEYVGRDKEKKVGVDKTNFAISNLIKKHAPFLTGNKPFQDSKRKVFKEELTNIVGTRILEDIYENGEGTLSKDQIKAIFEKEAINLGQLYKEYYGYLDE